MKKVKFFNIAKTTRILTTLLLSTSSAFSYADEAELAKYQQARIAVSYKGNIGDLAQQLAEKLGIGYYAVQHNSVIQVKLKQSDSHTLQQLLDQANQQLEEQQSKQQLRFDILNDKVVLALVGNNVSLAPTQFIGNVVYTENFPTADATRQEENTISIPVIAEMAPQVNEKDNTTLKNNENDVSNPLAVSTQYSEEDTAEAKKLRDILDISQDNKLLAQYAKRKIPSYNVPDQQAIRLETIRSTKISTFLIFKDGIDTAKYKVEGQFQDIAKVGNVVAILHRQKSPPKEILITTPENQQYKLGRVN